MNNNSKRNLYQIILAIVISLIINGLIVYANWYAVSPKGSIDVLWNVLFLFPLLLLSAFLMPIGLILLIWNRTRKVGFKIFIVTIIYLFTGICENIISDNIRMNAFYKLGERSMTLVNAIHRFCNENGFPPDSLNQLVPEFIEKIPNTGMAAYPEYHYCVGQCIHNQIWILGDHASSGGINFDEFYYFPNQNYQHPAYQVLGKWAYYHE